MKYEPTIGIEIHAELKTNSKVFSDTENSYGYEPNTKTNVIDLGYPGTLPTLNKEVINLGIKTAVMLNCKINKKMYFDRKNYFYPDNPKNYQITQSKTPVGYDGYLDIEINGNIKRIGIERVHIEEDTAKSIHNGNKTLLDFNRAGVPLIEIVTKPDISSGKEAILYLERLRQLLLYADISDVKIEQGSMRCDANISLKELGSTTLGIKTEVKNIGSISNVETSIDYEIIRQTKLLEEGLSLREETRRFDEKTATTILMRVKETGNDYRYFPEPDIPCIYLNDEWITNISNTLPLLPDERREKYLALGISEINANKIIQQKELSDFLDELIANKTNYIVAANLITTDILGYLNKNNKNISETGITVNSFKQLIDLYDNHELSSKMVKDLLIILLDNGGDIEQIIKDKGFKQISSSDELGIIITNVINSNLDSLNDYKNGKDNALKYLMGQIMKETKGQANPIVVNTLLLEIISKY